MCVIRTSCPAKTSFRDLRSSRLRFSSSARSSSPKDLHSGPYTESHFQLKARLVKFGG